MKVLDCRGVEIQEQDTVVYPGRTGSHLWVNVATVLGIERHVGGWPILKMRLQKGSGEVGKVVRTTCIDRVSVVQKGGH